MMKLFVVLSFLAACALSAPQGGRHTNFLVEHRDLRPTVSEIEVIPVDNSLPEDLSRGHYEVIEMTPVEKPRNSWFRRWFDRILGRKPATVITTTTTTPAPTFRPRTLEDDIAINYVGPLPRENPDAEIFDVELFNEDARRHSVGLSQPIRSQPMWSQPMMSQPIRSQPLMSQPIRSQPMRSQPLMSQPMRSQPFMSQPIRSQPMRSQPLMSQPMRSQPLMSQPIRSQPLMAGPARPQPLMSQPLRYRAPRV